MAVLTKESLLMERERATVLVPVPELGQDAEVLVQGYLIGDEIEIAKFSTEYDALGQPRVNAENDLIISIVKAIAEPKLDVTDAQGILKLHPAVARRIVNAALTLSGRGETAFNELKQLLKQNIVLQRLYSVCVNKLGRLPSELSGIDELEFMTALAALENDYEREQEALKEQTA